MWRSLKGVVAKAHGRERGEATRVALCRPGRAPALELTALELRPAREDQDAHAMLRGRHRRRQVTARTPEMDLAFAK